MKVMVIDDDNLVLETVGDYLRDAGHEAVLLHSAGEALRTMSESRVDAVVTDVLMPDMDGIEFIRRLRRDWPKLWVVAMSGGGQHLSAAFNLQFSQAFGANRLLAKPLLPDDLLAALPDA